MYSSCKPLGFFLVSHTPLSLRLYDFIGLGGRMGRAACVRAEIRCTVCSVDCGYRSGSGSLSLGALLYLSRVSLSVSLCRSLRLLGFSCCGMGTRIGASQHANKVANKCVCSTLC